MPRLLSVHPEVEVGDMSVSIGWYCEAIGFEVAFDDGDDPPGYVGLRRDVVEIHPPRRDRQTLMSDAGEVPAGVWTTAVRHSWPVQREPGLHPTTYLRFLFSQRVAAPGETVSVRVEGTDAGSMIRGKVLEFDHRRDGNWRHVGWMIGATLWHPASEAGWFAMSLEGYPGTMPLSFQVPRVPAGEYRVRLDLVRTGDEPVAERTATLYGFLRVLDGVADADIETTM
jgi:hypothetical protein